MKAETETGYEPSIRIQMEKQMNIETGQVWRTARILKDRSTRIDGQVFSNPTFKNFLPHIESLNLGGEHPGIDTSRDNSELFANDGTPTWLKEKRAKEIALDEINLMKLSSCSTSTMGAPVTTPNAQKLICWK
ncbi:TPA: AAA family ATPase, partial [Shigella flexneri]